MATEASVHGHDDHNEDLWSGGTQPFKASYGKLMMWYFLLSDTFTFAGFLIAYGALRFSMPTWPLPDFVFSTFPGGIEHAPLLFVTLMTFILIVSSVTMVRAVQEGHRENKQGVVFWMFLTIIGGSAFLSCQAWEWTKLIGGEHMSLTTNPFGTHTEDGEYLDNTHGVPYAANEKKETFKAGDSYLLHAVSHGNDHHGANGESHSDAGHEGEGHGDDAGHKAETHDDANHGGGDTPEEGTHGEDAHGDGKGSGEQDEHAATATVSTITHTTTGKEFIARRFKTQSGEMGQQDFGPRAFGALFFFITGFHGFHVLSGVAFLLIIMLNVKSGLYVDRKNQYEMVEKIGLYWHFVDLVWVFVFLVFYLL
jgi:cytochrome c oxidase subunit III